MASKDASSGALLGVMLGTAIAAGGGFISGTVLSKNADHAQEAASVNVESSKPPEGEVKTLAPIVTNLAVPEDVIVRLEAAILLEPNTPESAALAAKVSEDLLVFLRTVSISEIQGPTGFQYFRQDLKRHALQQGGGKIRDIFILAFAVE